MPPKKYNESNLDTMFGGIHEKLDAILVQTKITNGRVSSLERWRSYLAGAAGVLLFLISKEQLLQFFR